MAYVGVGECILMYGISVSFSMTFRRLLDSMFGQPMEHQFCSIESFSNA